MDHIFKYRHQISRQSACSGISLHLALPCDGFCPANNPAAPQRHRGQSIGTVPKPLSHGLPRNLSPVNSGRCQREWRLAHQRRIHAKAHYSGSEALLHTEPRTRSRQNGLRAGLSDHRSVQSLLPWAHFRSTKSAVKMHTLLDLKENIPSFIHISDGKLHDVHALDLLMPEPLPSMAWIVGTSTFHESRPCMVPAVSL